MLAASLALLCSSGLLLWQIQPQKRLLAGWLSALPPVAVFAWLWPQRQLEGRDAYRERWNWVESIGLQLEFQLDGLAWSFTLIILLIGAAVALYTHYYLHDDSRQGTFYLFLFLFMASMLGIVWADNVLLLFVFWEGTTFTSYFLIGHKFGEDGARLGARQALYVTGAGGLVLLWGLLLLASAQGTYVISEMISNPLDFRDVRITLALVLILVGAFTKSGQFPFHFWLPGAMAAPTPASAYLHSATMVKAGVYLIARLHPLLAAHPVWMPALVAVGSVTAVLCAIFALTKTDLKAMLAYATLTQLGLLFVALGLNTPYAAFAATLGIMAHAFYKGPLFLISGMVEHAASTRDYRSLGRLARPLKTVFATTVLACVSLAGLPLWPGFVAKEYLLEALLQSGAGIPQGLTILGSAAAGLAGASFAVIAAVFTVGLFLRRRPDDATELEMPHRPPIGMQAGPLLLALTGFGSPFILDTGVGAFIERASESILGSGISDHVHLWHGLGVPLAVSILAFGAGCACYPMLGRVLRFSDSRLDRIPRGAYLLERCRLGLMSLCSGFTAGLHGRSLSTHITITMFSAVLFVALAWNRAQFNFADLQIESQSRVLPLLEYLAVGIGAVGAITAVRARVRLTAIIANSVAGLMVTLWFVLFAAPDLALTQLLVEVLVFVLILIILSKLPDTPLPALSAPVWARNFALALGMGLSGFLLVLFSAGKSSFTPIGDLLLRAAPLGAHGGSNVVNVILVDFRGFDTFGEMTVVAIAGIGVFSLLRAHRLRVRAKSAPAGPGD